VNDAPQRALVGAGTARAVDARRMYLTARAAPVNRSFQRREWIAATLAPRRRQTRDGSPAVAADGTSERAIENRVACRARRPEQNADESVARSRKHAAEQCKRRATAEKTPGVIFCS
jgi:hypothetical protein